MTASSALVGSTSVTMTSAPAVAGDHELRSCEEEIGGADDAVNRGLPGAVTIVEQMLGVGVVDGHDRIGEHAFFRHGTQTNNPGGRFLGATNHVRQFSLALGMKHGDQVGAIVHGDLRLVIDRCHDVRIIRVVVFASDGENGPAVVADQAGSYIVLRGEWVRCAQGYVGAAVAQGDH
jgi:hypothetical protein